MASMTQPQPKKTHRDIFQHTQYISCDSHFTGSGGHRIANIAQEPPAHHIHQHCLSGGLKDGCPSAKINI